MKQRVIGHLPQLHHHVTQLPLCTHKRGQKLPTTGVSVTWTHWKGGIKRSLKLTLSSGGTLELHEEGLIESALFFTH